MSAKKKYKELQCWKIDKDGVEVDPGNLKQRYAKKRTCRFKKHKQPKEEK